MNATNIGQMLLKANRISSENLDKAIEFQKTSGARLGSCLLKLGLAKEQDVQEMLQRQYPRVRAISLNGFKANEELARLLPREIAIKHKVVAVSRTSGSLTVAMVDPRNLSVLRDLQFATSIPRIEACIAPEIQVLEAIKKVYGDERQAELKGLLNPDAIEVVPEDDESVIDGTAREELEQESQQTPIKRLVNWILFESFTRGASDIHLEPYERDFRIRYRIDGVLQTIPELALRLSQKDAVSSRIKIMANLDIAEKRMPQDGRIKVRMLTRNGSKDLDFRVSTLPTIFGEKIVLRLLDRENLKLDLAHLGFEPDSLRRFKDAIQKPVGMVLVTGPTGSGKTNTLYSAISALSTPDTNIVTIEDPVEINLQGVNQVQVKEHIGLTFAQALRSFLRQDPDIILVGEMRDQETAAIAVKAALTGHLVLSTLHTNDAPATVFRLLDMGMERFQVATSVHLVCAQRLVRRICVGCKARVKPPSSEVLISFGFSPEEAQSIPFFRGTGCDVCAGTGYKGRVGLFEVMDLSDDIREAVMLQATEIELRAMALANGMITLRQSGLEKIRAGLTTMDEISRETVS